MLYYKKKALIRKIEGIQYCDSNLLSVSQNAENVQSGLILADFKVNKCKVFVKKCNTAPQPTKRKRRCKNV